MFCYLFNANGCRSFYSQIKSSLLISLFRLKNVFSLSSLCLCHVVCVCVCVVLSEREHSLVAKSKVLQNESEEQRTEPLNVSHLISLPVLSPITREAQAGVNGPLLVR